MQYVRWFDDLGRESVPDAGGKGANLGEMTRAGLPVPPGFVITVDAYDRFLEHTGLRHSIEQRLAQLDVDDGRALSEAAAELQKYVCSAALPDDVRTAIEQAYQALPEPPEGGPKFVAVRSSATVEDAAESSFAGMFRSFLNVSGPEAVLRGVQECWASLFGARVIFYQARRTQPERRQIAVVVQRMVNAEKSGVLFTIDPASGDPNRIVIEAAWGLGELVVSGDVTPDRYVVEKAGPRIVERDIKRKEVMLTRSEDGNRRIDLDDERGWARVLSDEEILGLAELASRDEQHYGRPQDAEWAIAGSQTYLVQTRPVTTIGAGSEPAETEGTGDVLIRGLGASPGIAAGVVRVLHSVEDAASLQNGEILVTEKTSPDWVPSMRRAAAIVTDGGGITSHAAIVSRELGVPCIVGTARATTVLHDGQIVTVDGKQGTVRPGRAASRQVSVDRAAVAAPAAAPVPPITATRLYVNLAEPERAEAVAALPVDGVGLLRAEFMILSALNGVHPRQLLQEGRGQEFVTRITADLRRFAAAFAPRPVIYRSTDFKSNEFRKLTGGEQFEPVEENPMIGYRGCYRNIREPDLFALELESIRRVREEFSNLQLMIPFVRTRWEFAECKRLIDESGLTRDKNFQLWVMAEIPSVVYWIPEYAALGATGVSIGSNDLTQLMLGVDRDGETVAPLYDERDPAVLDAIQQIIERAHQSGLTASICGQAPSVYPEYAEMLVRCGIDSISVLPDAVEQTRRNIAAAEQRLLLADARRRIHRASYTSQPVETPFGP